MGCYSSKATQGEKDNKTLAANNNNSNNADEDKKNQTITDGAQENSVKTRPPAIDINEIGLLDKNGNINMQLVNKPSEDSSAIPADDDINRLVTIPFFDEISNKTMKAIHSLFNRQIYKYGEHIVEEGVTQNNNHPAAEGESGGFYVVISGSLNMTCKGANGHNIKLRDVKQGDWSALS
jgi:hypothetical protein